VAVSTKNGLTVQQPDESPDSNEESASRLPARSAKGGGFFAVYKRGQGYWTRMGTALGAGLLITVLALFVYEQAGARFVDKKVPGILTAVIVIVGLIAAWVLMNKPRSADFLIATDSEMKKVNWPTRAELMGSTRIVILFMFAIAMILFAIDVITGFAFQAIGLLKFGPWS
jgi:preprotein translocase subunit SecE